MEEHIEIGLPKDPEHVETLRKLAVKNTAPFGEKNDKGFKDAYIYLIIKEHLEKNKKDAVFLITNDGRLREAFEDEPRVTPLHAPKEYILYRGEYFKEQYFLDALGQFFSEHILENDVVINKSDIINIALTDNSDWNISMKTGGYLYDVSVDFASKEIISVTDIRVAA